MALIQNFEQRPIEPKKVHDGVVCGYAAVDVDGRRIVQLETYGSAARAIPGKVSQTIQLDEESARELIRILRGAFPGI